MNELRTDHRRGGAGIFLGLARLFWQGRTAPLAWILTASIAGLIFAGVAVQSHINSWNAEFFDALERRDGEIGALIDDFVLLVACAGVVMVVTVFTRMTLQVRLRRWLTERVMDRWLGDGRRLHMLEGRRGAETPEFRIADDVRLAVDPLVDLSVGFTGALLIAVTFFAVLAQVGGSLELPRYGITIPAYFLFAAVAYAFMMSGMSSLLGWPLVRSIEAKNHREGVLRYELTRTREGVVAGGCHKESAGILSTALAAVAASWHRVVIGQARVSGVASANAVLVGVFPVMLAVPKYLDGDLTLGAVMQLATAFVQVQMALNWIVDNFVRFAEWRASANRVGEFLVTIDSLPEIESEIPDGAGKAA